MMQGPNNSCFALFSCGDCEAIEQKVLCPLKNTLQKVVKILLLSGKTQITYKFLRNCLYIGNSAFFFEIQAP